MQKLPVLCLKPLGPGIRTPPCPSCSHPHSGNTGATRHKSLSKDSPLSSNNPSSAPEPSEELDYTWRRCLPGFSAGTGCSLQLSPLPSCPHGAAVGEGRPTLTRTCSVPAGLVLGV